MLCLVAVILSPGCLTQERCERRFPPITTSTESARDTTLHLPGDSLTGRGPLPQVGDTLIIHDTITKTEIKIIRLPGDTVEVRGRCPEKTITLPGYVKTITITKTPPPLPAKTLPWWRWPVLLLCAAALVFSGALLIKHLKS